MSRGGWTVLPTLLEPFESSCCAERDLLVHATCSFDGTDRHGEGLQLVEGWWQYRGAWSRGERHGHGECRYLMGARGAAPCERELVTLHGAAETTALEDAGGRYVGTWTAGMRHGTGRMEWRSGAWYEGTWVAGAPHGVGSGASACSDVYRGEWRAGVRQGVGRCRYANGDVYEGAWVGGLPHGKGTMRYACGEVGARVFRGDGGMSAVSQRSTRALWVRRWRNVCHIAA